MGQLIGTAVVAGAAGFAGGYFSAPQAAPGPAQTVTQTQTQTVTVGATTTAPTIGQAALPTSLRGTKIGIMTGGSPLDYGWQGVALLAAKRAEALGAEVRYAEMVSYPDQSRYFSEFVADGCNIVFANGSEFDDTATKFAWDNPDRWFFITCSRRPAKPGTPPNLLSMCFYEEEEAYLMAEIAARMTKTNKIGWITPIEIPCTSRMNAATRYAIYRNHPEVEVHAAVTGSITDYAREKELVLSMINEGCDFITCSWAGPGTFEACKEHNVYCTAGLWGMEMIPEVCACTQGERQDEGMLILAEQVRLGTARPDAYIFNLASGMCDVRVNEKIVPKGVIEAVSKLRAEIVMGAVKIPPLLKIPPSDWPAKAVPDEELVYEPVYPDMSFLTRSPEPPPPLGPMLKK